MYIREKEALKPYVDFWKCAAFDPKRPETYTVSPLMNDVMRAISVVGPHSSKAIADYLCLPSKKLWAAVEIITGLEQNYFRYLIARQMLTKLVEEHPDWSTDMYAHALGYKSRADLYRILGREEYNKQVSYKTKTIRFYKDRKPKTE